MREILFKAKTLKEEIWAIGYYIYHIKRTLCPFGDCINPEDEQHAIMRDGFSDWNMPRDTVYYDIDPNTLCQFTGFVDCRGRKIWEKDIVNDLKIEDDIGEPCYEQVVFHDGAWCLRESGSKDYHALAEAVQAIEVVGNIFDNPGLLEPESSNSCNTCIECAVIPSEHGIIRRCKVCKKLLEESHVEKERPKWCPLWEQVQEGFRWVKKSEEEYNLMGHGREIVNLAWNESYGVWDLNSDFLALSVDLEFEKHETEKVKVAAVEDLIDYCQDQINWYESQIEMLKEVHDERN